jgi:ABC-type multidrug transport system fused ATPase/permease subunit
MFKNVYNLISNIDTNLNKKLIFFIIILIFASILEVVGIGLIIPLISTIIDINNTFINNLPLEIKNYLGSFDKMTIVIILSIFICIFFIFKNFILIFITFFLSKFFFEIKNLLVKKLYRSYVTQEYNDFIKVSSSKRINNIITESQNVLEGTIMPLMTYIAELFVLFAICFLLLIYNFKITSIAIFVLLIITFLSLYIIKPILKRYGKIRLKHHENKVELVNQSIYGIREIKLFQMVNDIINIFNLNNDKLNNISFKHIFIQLITKFYLEIGAVISFVLIVIFYLKFNTDTKELITLLGLYGVSIFRIMPSINKIINSKNSLRYSELSVERILKDLSFINQSGVTKIEENQFNNKSFFENWKEIEFKDLNYGYNEFNEIIKNINFKIVKGEKIGILGKSGSGKSTLIDLICYLLEPKKGQILIDGKVLEKKNRRYYQNLFSYVSQNTFIFNTSLKNNITLKFLNSASQLDSSGKIANATKIAQLDDFINSLINKNDQVIGEEGNRLSGGQKQRIGIARSIYADRQIIIFDEATSALDEITENNLINSLMNNCDNKTIIFVTHKKHLLKKFDVILEIDNNGKLLRK